MNEPKISEYNIVGRSYAHDSARQHVTGAAIYLDDMAETSDCLHAAIVKSPHDMRALCGLMLRAP